MLQFLKDGKVLFENEQIDLASIDAESFFIANLNNQVQLEHGLKLETLMFHFSHIRDFIYKYFADHYDRLKPIIEASDSGGRYSNVKIFKKLSIEEGSVYLTPAIDLIPIELGEKVGPKFYGQLPIYISSEVVVIEDDPDKKVINGNLKTIITLQDVLESLFEDLVYALTEGLLELE